MEPEKHLGVADSKGAGSEAGQAPCCPGLVHLEHSEHWTQELQQWGGGVYHMWLSAPNRVRGLPFVQGAHGVPLENSSQGSAQS